MSRNVNTTVTQMPTSHLPRTKHKMPIFSHFTSAPHGYVMPFFIKEVYPASTWTEKAAQEIIKENSIRVPIDDIYHDTYFFYVPFRIIFEDWKKVLGDRDNPLDTSAYAVPSFTYYSNATLTGGVPTAIPFDTAYDPSTYQLPWFMGYSALVPLSSGSPVPVKNTLSCLPIWAYWKIINFYFRDENLQSWMDYQTQLPDGDVRYGCSYNERVESGSPLVPFKAGRYHDYFSNGTLSPQRGPEVLMHLDNELIPVNAVGSNTHSSGSVFRFTAGSQSNVAGNYFIDSNGDYTSNATVTGITGSNLFADAKNNGISIDQFRIAMMTTALYERKNMFGSRYDEYLRGVWGEDIPASLIEEPEYLGGERVDLSQIPVFGTGATNTGTPTGVSNTGALAGEFFKTFLESGYIIGLHVFRVKHTYGQGLDPLWQHFDELDFYNPLFANQSFQPRFKKELVNTGEMDIDSIYNIPKGDLVWNYNEAYSSERIYNSMFSGLFNPGASYHDPVWKQYGYLDIYDGVPTYSSSWLQEPTQNIIRTLAGGLIPNSTSEFGVPVSDGDGGYYHMALAHQYLIKFTFAIEKTMALPAHSVPVTLLGRL